jgi:tetratricopeptide (TPR) repeat protein
VLSLRPNDYVALYYHALALFRRDMPDSGFVCLTKAVEQDTLFYAAVYELAVRNLLRKNIEETFRWYDRAVQLRPMNAKLLSEVSTLYQKANKHRLALPYALRATEIDSTNATYAEQTGLLYYSLGSFDSSTTYLIKATTLEKENWSYILNLALAYVQMDSTQQAIGTFREAIHAFGLDDGANLYLRFGNFLSVKNEYAEASVAYERALEIDPTNREPRFRLATMYVQMDKRAAAKQEFRRYLQSLPTDSTSNSMRQTVEAWLKYLDRPKTH